MHRSKVFAVAAALVAAATAAVVFAGSASAATWHVYQGDVYAGHAYGLQVPEDAESVEFAFAGAEAGSAEIAVYDPAGEKVGSYALGPSLTTASIAEPAAGRYVVYVYEVTDGALTIRVASEKQPALDLTQVPLVREEREIGTFEQGKLDQVITTSLDAQPVFVTLLYEGSATDLDATVASEKGAVVTIVDETATAFSPGVWTSLKGERAFEPANLEGTAYTVEVHAASFEGTMVLTTLGLDLAAPAPEPEIATPQPRVPKAPTSAKAAPSPAQFALPLASAVAFEAPAGKLLLVDPAELEREASEESNDSKRYGDYEHSHIRAVVSLYAPDDTLLAVVELDDDAPAAEVELPVAGEYVAYTHAAHNDVVLAKLDGAQAPPAIRQLALEEEIVELAASSYLVESNEMEFELEHAPVDIALFVDDAFGTLSMLDVSNEKGSVAGATALVLAPGADMFAWTHTSPENYAAGAHTLRADGVFDGTLTLVSTYYVRHAEVPAEVDAHVEHEEHEPNHGEPPTPPAPPTPPPPPLSAPGVLDALGLPL